jgi:hypothetical protein
MNDLKHIRRFNESEENLNISDVSDSDNLDLPMELEYKLRTIDETSNLTVDDFLEECGIDLGNMTGFAWASILKQKEERFSEIGDEEFFNLYKEYKSKL